MTGPSAEESDSARRAILALDLAIQLQGALGEQCHGHISLPSGGGLRCRRVVNHPSHQGGLFADQPAERHVALGGMGDTPRWWTDDDMGAMSHREWFLLHGAEEMQRRADEDAS